MKRYIGLVLAIALPGPVLASSGYFVSGYSVSQLAMAGAATTMVEDALVASVNPANMVWLDDRLDVGLTAIYLRRGYTSSPRGDGAMNGLVTIDPATIDSRRTRFYIPGLGFKHHIDEVSSWGLSIYANGGLNTTYKGGSVTFAQNIPLLQEQCNGFLGGGARLGAPGLLSFCGGAKSSAFVDAEQLFVVPSYSRKLGSYSSFGIEPIIAMQQLRLGGLGAFSRFSNDPDNVTDKGYDRSFGGGFRIGVLSSPLDWFSVGASYQSRLQMTKMKRYSGLFAQNGEFDLPMTWNAGIGISPSGNQKIAIDLQRIYFHQVKSAGNRLDSNDFVNNCVLPRLFGNDAPSPSCLGGDKGPGFGWHNSSALKIGYQVRFSDWIFRLGYSYDKSVIPSDQVLFNALVPSTLRDSFSGGISYKFSPAISVDSSVLYGPDTKITGKNPLSNTPANLAQLVAAGVLPGGKLSTANAFGPNPNDQDITIHAHALEVSVGMSYHF